MGSGTHRVKLTVLSFDFLALGNDYEVIYHG